MSRLPLFEADPVDQPAATDLVERRTWSALRIRIGNRSVTRIWDKSLEVERAILYVPIFPIAQWIVRNWWSLLYEPCRLEEVPAPGAANTQFSWIKRHNIRSADAGLLLPSLYLFSNGQSMRAAWQADSDNSLLHMAGRFIDDGSDSLDLEATREALTQFVAQTLDRIRDLQDDRVAKLNADWHAIQAADSEESQFCIVVGRMGLDPYDVAEVSEELAVFIEKNLGDPDLPIVRDITEVADANSLAQQWEWVRTVTHKYGLGRNKKEELTPRAISSSPAQHGYDRAQALRSFSGIKSSDPLSSIEQLASALETPFTAESSNHVPGHGIRAVVGWTPNRHGIIAGPLPARDDSRRFLLARGLYHMLFASGRSERLVTDAHTWDQKASRAFAAELLAPQQALLERTRGWADEERIAQLAAEFKTSPVVIEKQLRNAGVTGFD